MSNPLWQPNTLVQPFACVLDSNGNVQQASANGGTTGSLPPNWNTTPSGSTPDNGVLWTLIIVPPSVTAALPNGPLNLPIPTFVNDSAGLDPNAVLNEMVTAFQSLSGRTLQPAQVERLLIDLYAYRESMVRQLIQYVGQQCLLAFAVYPMLDYLGQLLGVSRLQAQGATTTLQFTLTSTFTFSVTIPAGTPVGTADGLFQFATQQALVIPPGQISAVAQAVCSTPGAPGNGYAVGSINVLLSPNAFVASVSNTTISTGGSAPETDNHLRERIQAAPNQFSVAGPEGAYRFFTLGVDPSIMDVAVVNTQPGTVTVYVLTGPITTQPAASPNNQGIAGTSLLNRVAAALNDNNVRPLTDTVVVAAVTEVDYQIDGTITIFADADPTATSAAVNLAAQNFALNLASRVQRDIVPSEIISALSVGGVYQVALSSPTYTQLAAGQWANLTLLSLSIVVGTEHS
jgi:phage-related baseplate assembly protein